MENVHCVHISFSAETLSLQSLYRTEAPSSLQFKFSQIYYKEIISWSFLTVKKLSCAYTTLMNIIHFSFKNSLYIKRLMTILWTQLQKEIICTFSVHKFGVKNSYMSSPGFFGLDRRSKKMKGTSSFRKSHNKICATAEALMPTSFRILPMANVGTLPRARENIAGVPRLRDKALLGLDRSGT